MQCPAVVTPSYLEKAEGHPSCSTQLGQYFCRVLCREDEVPAWVSYGCPQDGVSACPPWPRVPLPGYVPDVTHQPTVIHGPWTKQEPTEPVRVDGGIRHSFTGRALVGRAEKRDREAVEKAGGFNLRGIAVSDPPLLESVGL